MILHKQRSFQYLWLIFLLMPVLVMRKEPLPWAIVGYAAIALFLFAYWRALRSATVTHWQIAQVLAFVLFMGYTFDPSLLNMIFYLAPLLGQLPTRRGIMLWTGGVILGLAVAYLVVWPSLKPTALLTNLPIHLGVLLLPYFIFAKRREQQLRNELGARETELMRQEERHRIAKDLHDTLGHTLSLIALKSELAERLVKVDPERAASEIRTVRETARKALGEAREIVSQMRSVTLQAELAAAAELLATAGIRLSTAVEPVPLTPLIENLLGLCLREAVTNVVRHSGARRCAIALREDRGELLLTISDDGRGMAGASSGTGLQSMQDRLQLVEGQLTIEGPPGTTLTLAVPKVVRGGLQDG